MALYYASGVTAATAATAGHAAAAIWNPSTSKRIKLLEFHIFTSVAPAAAVLPAFRRTTARGTAGSTITPTSVYEEEQIAAPPSGFLLDLAAFTVQPTLATGELAGGIFPAAIGSGFAFVFRNFGLEIKAGEGLALVTSTAVAITVSRVNAIVED